MFDILAEINDVGMLEAANSILKAKETITKIILCQFTC